MKIMENLQEDYIYYKKCKENKKGNYYKSNSILKKIFLTILFLGVLYFGVSTLFRVRDMKNISDILIVIMLWVPIFFIEKYLINEIFYKLELDKDKLIVLENLKKSEISYSDLKKYQYDRDFIFGIQNKFLAIKIGEEKYFKIKWGEKTNIHFLWILFKEKLEIVNTEEDIEKMLSKKIIFQYQYLTKNSKLKIFLITVIFLFFIIISQTIIINFDVRFDEFLSESYFDKYDILVNFNENIQMTFWWLMMTLNIAFLVLSCSNTSKISNEFSKIALIKNEKKKIKKIFIYIFVYIVVLFLVGNFKYILIMLKG